ncbi:hypothetical protein ACH4TP_37990 [Streptomyces sp. NPDC021012]|uniref:hypothetical protein n=1 Tax=Streptomyces sp. NPDC021012 TaxID=3365107 RepID=UPI0037B7C396
MSLVTRDPVTGLRRDPIVYPNGQPPTPYGCRWCGTEQSGHGRRWKPSVGVHWWAEPTRAQILARMRARRRARLNTPPAQYHAATVEETGWSHAGDRPYTSRLCADCGEGDCRRWIRTQERLWVSKDPRNHTRSHGPIVRAVLLDQDKPF